MAKTTEEKTNKPKRNIQFGKLVGLVVALADMGAAYIFFTQDNEFLWGFGTVLVLQAAYWFVENVVLSKGN